MIKILIEPKQCWYFLLLPSIYVYICLSLYKLLLKWNFLLLFDTDFRFRTHPTSELVPLNVLVHSEFFCIFLKIKWGSHRFPLRDASRAIINGPDTTIRAKTTSCAISSRFIITKPLKNIEIDKWEYDKDISIFVYWMKTPTKKF